ncbi:Nuclear receptor domain-containing protein [Aphelenchoides besseyi]|nr:Nuclear receptor domain-containing protein [Aphelenchoides besseyi]KAI6224089.1 Nuclear receptor domain-containing protein [Aphelenchoides besseyi]
MFCFDDFMDHKPIDSVPSDPDNKRLIRSRTIGGSRAQECEICGDFAYSRHFRVTSCRACAAFFRRSVALRRSYNCSRNHECEIRASQNSRHFCRFCRFQRCVQSGMNLNAIVERDADEYRCFPVNSPIRKALMAQKASFVNRYTAHLNLCAGDHTLVRMGKENPQLANIVTVKSEFPVLIQYLVGSGFEDCDLNQQEIFNLGKELFYTWISYTSIIATMKNSGHKLNFSYFIDESFVKATDNEVQHFVHTCPNLLDYNMAARATIDCCSENITSAARLHQMRMDDVEHSALFQIYALNTAIRMFPHHQELRRSLDQVFDQIKQHYLRNFEDVSVKMGSMILMLSQLSHWTEFLQEYVSYLYLTGYSPVLSELKSSAEVKVKTEIF